MLCYSSTCLSPYGPFFFFFNDTATTEIYTLSLHDALPILSAARKAARSSRRSRCASGLALHVRARSSPSMALGRLSGEPTHGVQRCPPMSGGDRYASTNAITVRRTVVGATGGLASRDGERPARNGQRLRDRCHHHDHGSGVEGAARHGPRRARAGCSGPAHLCLELRVCRHLLEQ